MQGNAWFGTDWGAHICKEQSHIETPVGRECDWCHEPISAADAGFRVVHVGPPGDAPFVYFHYECQIRQIAGSVGHQRKQCLCFGGTMDDPPDVSRREAARQATELAKLSI